MTTRPSTSSQRSSMPSVSAKNAALLMRGCDWIFIESPQAAVFGGILAPGM
jgi:hypothetical protein